MVISLTQLIIDSTCDMNKTFMKENNISILPLNISLGDVTYKDKVNIEPTRVYEAMKKGIFPKTAQPLPYDMLEIFESFCKRGEDFIYLAFSGKLSGTYQTASVIIKQLKSQYSGVKMACIDSKGGSLATGLIAEDLIDMRSIKEFEEVVEGTKARASKIQHLFTINDLSWLVKGGRISKVERAIGQILNIKPILHVRDGFMEVIAKERGRRKAYSKLISLLESRISNEESPKIGISHADNLEDALIIKAMIEDRFGYTDFRICQIGSTLASHLGIGGVGLFFYGK